MWAIGIKNGMVTTGGLNLVIDGTFTEFIPVPENVARQIWKLEYLGEGKYKVKEGQTLLSVEELNYQRDNEFNIEEPAPIEKINIIEPIEQIELQQLNKKDETVSQ